MVEFRLLNQQAGAQKGLYSAKVDDMTVVLRRLVGLDY